MRQNQIELSKNAYEIIDRSLKHRIPFLKQIRIDDNPDYLHQADMFGNIDTILSVGGSERFLLNQNKTRCPDATSICFECRSFRSMAYNMNSEKLTPIAGMHYVPSLGRYLSPRFGNLDTVTVYMSGSFTTYHLHRYFLDALFSGEEVWKLVHKYFITYDRTDTYVIYLDAVKFIQLYMECVARLTFGDAYTITLTEPEENKQVPKELA